MFGLATTRGVFYDSKNIPLFDAKEAREMAIVTNNLPPGYYTLIVYDPDVPYPHSPERKTHLHALIVNMPNGDTRQGNIIIPYQAPNPPRDSPPHRYYFCLYLQPSIIDTVGYSDFNLNTFLLNFGLQRVAEIILYAHHTPAMEASISRSVIGSSGHEGWFRDDGKLTDKEKSFCACVMKVAAKQSGAYNPYAICAKSVGTTSRHCGENTNFENIPEAELIAYAKLHHLSVPTDHRSGKENALRAIREWKAREGK